MICSVASPAGISCATVSVAVSVVASSVTIAGCVRLAAANRHVAEIDLRGVQNDRPCSRLDLHADGFPPAKRRLLQIGGKPQRVVVGNDGVGEPLGGRGRYMNPLKQREKQEKDVKTPLHAPNGTTSARFWQWMWFAAGASAVYAQFGCTRTGFCVSTSYA